MVRPPQHCPRGHRVRERTTSHTNRTGWNASATAQRLIVFESLIAVQTKLSALPDSLNSRD